MNYWIIDPSDRSVEGWVLQGDQFIAAGRAVGAGSLRLPPFPTLEIQIERLWRE